MSDFETVKAIAEWVRNTSIVLIGVSYYFTVRYLSRDHPTIYLDDFYVPSLNKTSHSLSSLSVINTTTSSIYFDLKIQNENSGVGVYYENPLNLTFTYFQPTKTTINKVTIGKYTIQGFYQGNGKVKHVQDFVVVQDLFSAQTVDSSTSDQQQRRKLGGTFVPFIGPTKVVALKVDLEAKIKFKSIENKKSHLMAGLLVEVNGDTGDVLQKKTLELNYESGSNKWGAVQWLLFFPLFVLFLLTFSACVVFLLFVRLLCFGY